MIETWVSILKRVSLVESRLRVIKRKPVGHTIHFHKIGRWQVYDFIVVNKSCHFRAPQFRHIPVTAIKIRRRTTENSFNRTRHQPILATGIKNIGVACLRTFLLFVIVDIAIFKLCKCILRLATFYQSQQFAKCLSGLLTIVFIIVVSLSTSQLWAVLHQRASCPQIILTQITQRHDFIDSQLVLTLCSLTCTCLVPVYRQQVCSTTEILSSLIGTFLITQTW